MLSSLHFQHVGGVNTFSLHLMHMLRHIKDQRPIEHAVASGMLFGAGYMIRLMDTPRYILW